MKSHNCVQILLCLAVLPMLINCLRFNLVKDDDNETGDNSLVKPGVCPVYKKHNVCKIKCNTDSDCEGVKKCCPTGCGTVCEARVQSPQNGEAARPKRRKQSNQEAPTRKQKVRTQKKDSRSPQQRSGKCPAFDSTRDCKKETIECQTNSHCDLGQICCEFECGRKCIGSSLVEESFESDDSDNLEVPNTKSTKKIEQFVSRIADKEKKRKQKKSLEDKSDEGDYDYEYDYGNGSDDEDDNDDEPNGESEYEQDYYDNQLQEYNLLPSPQQMFATPYLSNRQNMMMALNQQQMMPMQHYPFQMAGMPHVANQVPFLPQAVTSFLPANRNLASVGKFLGMPRNSQASFAPMPNNFAGMHGMHPSSFVGMPNNLIGMPSVRQPIHPGLMGPPRSQAEFFAKIPKFNLAPSE